MYRECQERRAQFFFQVRDPDSEMSGEIRSWRCNMELHVNSGVAGNLNKVWECGMGHFGMRYFRAGVVGGLCGVPYHRQQVGTAIKKRHQEERGVQLRL